MLQFEKSPRVIPLPFLLLVTFGLVNQDLTVLGKLYADPLKRPWSRSFKINPARIETTAVARALEFALISKPVRGTAQVGTYREQRKHALSRSDNPDTKLFFPPFVDTRFVIRRVTRLEGLAGFKKDIRKHESKYQGQRPESSCRKGSPGYAKPRKELPARDFRSKRRKGRSRRSGFARLEGFWSWRLRQGEPLLSGSWSSRRRARLVLL